MIQEIISKHVYSGYFPSKRSHQIILVSDTHLRALMSLYVRRSELLNSSPCVLCCVVPRSIDLGSDYYLNKTFFLYRLVQRFFDFVIHSFKPFPKRLYSCLEEENYLGHDMGLALGGILDKSRQQGLVYKIMLDIDRDRLSKVLKIPHMYRLLALVCIGFPIEEEEDLSSVGIYLNTFGGAE